MANTNLTGIVYVRFTEEDRKEIELLAAREGRTISNMVRYLTKMSLANNSMSTYKTVSMDGNDD